MNGNTEPEMQLVSKYDLWEEKIRIETMQDEATDNLNIGSEQFILWAEQLTYKASGRLNSLRDLKLLTNNEIAKLFTKQNDLEELLRNKKAGLKSANPSPADKK